MEPRLRRRAHRDLVYARCILLSGIDGMKLYHGTSWAAVHRILADGLKPRARRKGNWTHSVDSHPDVVYLTNAYGLHFAFSAAKGKAAGAILEIDVDRLPLSNLCPDEDAMEQAMRGRDNLPEDWSMEKRTAYYRKRLALSGEWEKSLAVMGTCGHMGTIPAVAINRVAKISHDAMLHFIVGCGYDPSICTMNYQLLGNKYRDWMTWLFDGEEEDRLTRKGVEISYGPLGDISEKGYNQRAAGKDGSGAV
jgi:hypothetical protein